jgi:tetratricopeptide (TPR) repeat protein
VRLLFASLGLVLSGLPAIAGSPAEARMNEARVRVEQAKTSAQPTEHADALIALASAHTARAREIADSTHYDMALALLDEARRVAPDRAPIDKIEAWTRLGRHEFGTAERLAREATAAHPEDAEAWGILGDALMELARIEEAGDAYQAMMNRKPGPGAYQRAAFYRERLGDLKGATTFLERAFAATAHREHEQRAWLLVQLAAIDRKQERTARAVYRLEEALALFDDYHYALAPLAELSLEAGQKKALAQAKRLVAVAPHAEHFRCWPTRCVRPETPAQLARPRTSSSAGRS